MKTCFQNISWRRQGSYHTHCLQRPQCRDMAISRSIDGRLPCLLPPQGKAQVHSRSSKSHLPHFEDHDSMAVLSEATNISYISWCLQKSKKFKFCHNSRFRTSLCNIYIGRLEITTQTREKIGRSTSLILACQDYKLQMYVLEHQLSTEHTRPKEHI